MPTPITNTTVNFTYKVADELFSTSDAAGNTADATYTGPDRIWVFVDADTGALNRTMPDLTSMEDGADVPTPDGELKVEIVAADDPLIISIIKSDLCETQNQTQITETLPDGRELLINNPADVDQTYDIDSLVYNTGTSSWDTPAYKESTVTWEDKIHARNNMLLASDGKIAPDMPDDIKQEWLDFRQTLRDLPSTFGYGTDSEIAAWKVLLPDEPGISGGE
jgi:hypothetical protein